METKNYLEPKRLAELQKRVWKIAKEHGWHDKPLSFEHHCGLIMTEVAEAVEADRNGRRSDDAGFKKGLTHGCILVEKCKYMAFYKNYIKGSIEEEFADIVIRLVDMAQEIHGDDMQWCGIPIDESMYNDRNSFIVNAWCLVSEVLGWFPMTISDSVSYMFEWAEHLNIDLWQHIEWKMRYNELRPYKHGGKKY